MWELPGDSALSSSFVDVALTHVDHCILRSLRYFRSLALNEPEMHDLYVLLKVLNIAKPQYFSV